MRYSEYTDPASGTVSPGVVVETGTFRSSASFSRPNDVVPYAKGDLIANAIAAGQVVPLAFDVPAKGSLSQVKLISSSAGAPIGSVEIQWFSALPTFAAGDNAPLSTTESGWLGRSVVGFVNQFTDGGLFVETADSTTICVLPWSLDPAQALKIYGVLVARQPFTPAAGAAFTASIFGRRLT